MTSVILHLGSTLNDIAAKYPNLSSEDHEMLFAGHQKKEHGALIDAMSLHLNNPSFVTILDGAAKKKGIVIGATTKAAKSTNANTRLKPEQKDKIKAMHLEGKSAKEISEAVGTTTNTVHSYIKKFKEAQAKVVTA